MSNPPIWPSDSISDALIASTRSSLHFHVSISNSGVALLVFNRPSRFNAITGDMYAAIADTLYSLNSNPLVKVAVLTGNGDYYCSGNDLGNFAAQVATGKSMQEMADASGGMLRRFVDSFIDFEKPLIAAVNGPAFGIAVTTLALCDVVYCSSSATFVTPFASLGQAPEGVSSHLFPLIMGRSNAAEVLMFGKQLSGIEAKSKGFVSEVFQTKEELIQQVGERAKKVADMPPLAMREIKRIIRVGETETFKKVNEREVNLLVKLWQGEECVNAIMKFMEKGEKKKEAGGGGEKGRGKAKL